MAEEQIRRYANGRGFHPQMLERWMGWDQAARDALLRLAIPLKLGENHLRDLMDWLEEIALRDQTKIAEVLARKSITEVESHPRLGRADKLKRIKEEIRRLRFPRLAQVEDSIRVRIRELKLHPQIRISVPPGLEGGRLQVEFSASSADDLLAVIAKLADAAGKDALREIFGLLGGDRQMERSTASK
jgi:hypothetical protein